MAPPITIRLNDQDSVVIARSTLLPGTEIAPNTQAKLGLPRFGRRFVGLRARRRSRWIACLLRRPLANDIPAPNGAALDCTSLRCS